MEEKREPPSFCKVMLPDFFHNLPIPLAFVRNIGGDLDHGVVVLLRTWRGGSWSVEVRRDGDRLCLRDGWGRFLEDHSVRFGDFLVFTYSGGLEIGVRVFGRHGCEKVGSLGMECSHGSTRNRGGSYVSESTPVVRKTAPEGLVPETECHMGEESSVEIHDANSCETNGTSKNENELECTRTTIGSEKKLLGRRFSLRLAVRSDFNKIMTATCETKKNCNEKMKHDGDLTAMHGGKRSIVGKHTKISKNERLEPHENQLVAQKGIRPQQSRRERKTEDEECMMISENPSSKPLKNTKDQDFIGKPRRSLRLQLLQSDGIQILQLNQQLDMDTSKKQCTSRPSIGPQILDTMSNPLYCEDNLEALPAKIGDENLPVAKDEVRPQSRSERKPVGGECIVILENPNPELHEIPKNEDFIAERRHFLDFNLTQVDKFEYSLLNQSQQINTSKKECMAKSSSVELGFLDAISNSFHHQDGDLKLLPIGIDHEKLCMAKKKIRSELFTCLHEDKLTDPLVLQSTEEGLEVNQLSTFSNSAVNICCSPRINDAPTEPGSSLFVEISHEVQHDTPGSSQCPQSTILTMDYCSQNETDQSNQMQADHPSETNAARLPFNSSSFNDDHNVAISCETSSHSLKGMIQNDRPEAAEKKHDLQHQWHIKSDNRRPEVLFGVSHHLTEKTDQATHEYVPSTDMQSCMGQMTGEISTVGKSTYNKVFVSKRKPVTNEEKERAFQMAREFKSKNPFFTIVMKPTHVYRGFYMTIPVSFAKVYLSKKQRDIILEASQSWHVRCIYRKNYVALSKGWSTFVWGNNLEEGDVCIFELVKSSKFTFKVHIYRVVEEVVPLCRSCEQET